MLNTIIASKRSEVEALRRKMSLKALREAAAAAPRTRSLSRALREQPGVSLIAEVKGRSPSAGVIRAAFDPVEIACIYEGAGAAAVSVLTDHTYFGGRPEYLSEIRRSVKLPLLRKDFIISEHQVYESRVLGADAVLLIAAVLDDHELKGLMELTAALGMESLVEVHSLAELERATAAGASLVGINNRDLGTFRTDLKHTRELAVHLPPEVTTVSESGIRTRDDVLALEAWGVDAVLVGETLMRADDIDARVRELLGTSRQLRGKPLNKQYDKAGG
ncbi:indole-3-glycerol phosphate synthase TrpC [Candidatus Desulforudis audaxviator]|uniref:Indole-3-glycerol phosphate synthase n=1 Tax=Desulforudis audaxviator (strain MP104C) TaxID=477974 RepID=B1I3Z7_DESAP|nr:indole-3-glycerol phosphate synthase TrpC [Candidatus Desulforudis audaxviator]ACA59699.1 Indole-3-glycerol-phosphate synthase [Candidatus Desulforudis audaxviator MP104C]AZK59692.1 Indole-3-glycerol phosphate synthase [Candidatus Desulforudis audaxviator]